MRIKDYPANVAAKAQYTSGDLAVLLGISVRSASVLMDKGNVKTISIPGLKGKRILHNDLVTFLDSSPDLAFAKAKLVAAS
jgi:hypothetical protein